MPIDKQDGILTIDQTAELLRVSTKTIYDLVSQERIPGRLFARKVWRSWVFCALRSISF